MTTRLIAASVAVCLGVASPGGLVEASDDELLRVPTTRAEVSLDGRVDQAEWSDAAKVPADPSGDALVQVRDGHLFLALRAPKQVIGSVCVARGERVRVLHASAALGTATFEPIETAAWSRSGDFDWCCRGRDEAELARHLASEGWVATTFRRGAPGELEFRIDPRHAAFAGEGPLRIATVALDFESDTLFRSPGDLTDGCAEIDLVQGEAGADRAFRPESWHALALPGGAE